MTFGSARSGRRLKFVVNLQDERPTIARASHDLDLARSERVFESVRCLRLRGARPRPLVAPAPTAAKLAGCQDRAKVLATCAGRPTLAN